jgi:hypothetical protein
MFKKLCLGFDPKYTNITPFWPFRTTIIKKPLDHKFCHGIPKNSSFTFLTQKNGKYTPFWPLKMAVTSKPLGLKLFFGILKKIVFSHDVKKSHQSCLEN